MTKDLQKGGHTPLFWQRRCRLKVRNTIGSARNTQPLFMKVLQRRAVAD
jgi:hypothetical protein